jgi:hypothetical protein
MKKLTFLIMMTLTSLQLRAGVLDVKSTGNYYIKITKVNHFRNFELCNKINNVCERIGSRLYHRNELEDLHTKLAWQLGGSSVGTVLGVVCAGTGILAGGAAIGGAVSATSINVGGLALGTTLIGGSTFGAVTAALSKYNPKSLYDRMDAVNEDVREDHDYFISGGDEEIEEFAEDLDDALSEI